MKVIISIGALVAIFALAALGYNYLSKEYTPTPVLPNVSTEADNNNTTNGESTGNTETGTSEIHPAPDFTVYDLDGNKVMLSEKKGKPVIINFWATWCGPCKKEMPHFQKAYEELSDKIEFMMINPCDGMNDTRVNIDKFIAENPYTFPILCDSDIDAGSKYPVSGFPTTFFITSDGYLLGYYPGTMSEETLYGCINILLSNEESMNGN